ncbi:MAG: hypothetical protein ACFFBD_13355 [Candidatus Hodarchaeota archaeon]
MDSSSGEHITENLGEEDFSPYQPARTSRSVNEPTDARGLGSEKNLQVG